MPKTLFDKIWEAHEVAPGLLYIDLHLVHEVTSPQAFDGLRLAGRPVRRPDRTLATADHNVPTDGTPVAERIKDELSRVQVQALERNCQDFGVPIYSLGSEHQGIVHVIGPELGITQPGMTIVCGDSHTATHGAFGALAFGIGTSEVEHVLATQCLLQRKSKSFQVRVEGTLKPGVSAKDIILALIAQIGVGGGTGCVFEFTGSAIRSLSMEERMTVCNMSIEGGARAGLIAPDETTFEYLKGRPHAPKGADWDAAVERWKQRPSDEGAVYDRTITIDADALEPMITYGTNPGMGMAITAALPDPSDPNIAKALKYMGLEGGRPLLGHPIDVVFIGSCTNSRISDLRTAASILKGRKVKAPRVMIVPGSHIIKDQAEAEGLHTIFKEAGCEWREPGCSMCLAMNGDELKPGQYCVSTSNRNFEGRQGKGGRTLLASPLTAAATAIEGKVADCRRYV